MKDIKRLKTNCIALIIMFLCLGSLNAQGKKTLKKNKIKSITQTETENGITVTDEKKVFDANGEVIEEYKYNKAGKLDEIKKYKYNSEGDVTEEITLDAKSKQKERKVTTYNADNDKKTEEVFDALNKLTKKHEYIYGSNGLKSERRTYDAKGKLKSIKKFTYEVQS